MYSIQENNGIKRNQLKFFGKGLNKLEKNNAINKITDLLDTFINAKEYGSILNVNPCDWDLLQRFVESMPPLIALCSIALAKPTVSSLAVLGEISISGTLIKVDELANALQVCLDSGAKKVLLPITSAADLGTVPAELIGSFNLIFYSSAEDAVYKALGVE